jgi:hypothetical protein
MIRLSNKVTDGSVSEMTTSSGCVKADRRGLVRKVFVWACGGLLERMMLRELEDRDSGCSIIRESWVKKGKEGGREGRKVRARVA